MEGAILGPDLRSTLMTLSGGGSAISSQWEATLAHTMPLGRRNITTHMCGDMNLLGASRDFLGYLVLRGTSHPPLEGDTAVEEFGSL